jgi:hypothetical protein
MQLMQRRLFALMAALAPFSALAQTAPAPSTTPAPAPVPAPSTAPAEPSAAPATPRPPRKKLVEKNWDELTHRQRERLLHGFGSPQPSADEARTRWDGMDVSHRRAVARAAARYRKQQQHS